jgi:hypothetical protein
MGRMWRDNSGNPATVHTFKSSTDEIYSLLCDYKTLLKRWSCDSKWVLTLERQFVSVFSLDFVFLLYRFRFFPLDFVFLLYRFRFFPLDFVFLLYRFRFFPLDFVFLLYRFRFFPLDFVFLLYRFRFFRWISFSYFTDFVGFCFRFFSFLSLPVPQINWPFGVKQKSPTHSNPEIQFCIGHVSSHL